MTLFIVLQFPTTLLTIQYGILPMPTYSSAHEAFFLAFINKNSTILISLDDYDTSSHAGLQQQEPYRPFPFQLTLYPFQLLYCTILINSSGGVTCDQLDKISPPASQHVTWDKPEISAKQANHLYSAKTFWMHGDDNSDEEKLRNAHLVSLCSIVLWLLSNSEQFFKLKMLLTK